MSCMPDRQVNDIRYEPPKADENQRTEHWWLQMLSAKIDPFVLAMVIFAILAIGILAYVFLPRVQ